MVWRDPIGKYYWCRWGQVIKLEHGAEIPDGCKGPFDSKDEAEFTMHVVNSGQIIGHDEWEPLFKKYL